jgi:YVTN family beta-propeller protein
MVRRGRFDHVTVSVSGNRARVTGYFPGSLKEGGFALPEEPEGSGSETRSREQGGHGSDDDAAIRTFLIADVRGYTLFTQERGDEAAAKLAARFASIAREGVEARGGRIVELRGDEALAVFGSARQAIRAAVDLQGRFLEETVADPSLPLTVGIGIDAGEAVPVEGGYRGGALNLAARLCGQASAGEILASQEATHLARKVEGVRFEDRGEAHLKGIAAPVRIVRVVSEGADPALEFAPFVPPTKPAPKAAVRFSRLRERKALLAVVILVVLAGTVIPIVLTRGGGGLEAIGSNSVGQIALGSGTIRQSISVGTGPSGVAYGLGAVWVANATDGTVSEVDPRSGRAVTIRVGNDPTGVAVDPKARAVWVTNGTDGTVSRIDVATGDVSGIQVGNGPAGVAVGLGGVWVANSLDDTVSFIDDPAKGTAQAAIPVGATPTGVTIADDSVWVTNSSDGTVSRIDPGPHPLVRPPISVGQGPTGIASGSGGIWVANSYGNSVSKIDPSTGNVTAIPVGKGPNGVAIAGGSVWVSNEFGASLSQIDPSNGTAKTVLVGSAPQALAAAGGSLWVSTRGVPTDHRGGTLTVAVTKATLPHSLDPMPRAQDELTVFPLSTLTNDGLVALRHVGGAAGSTVVPNLATGIPAPTDGGRMFTFQLRPGITYSDGRPVKAGDVRRGIERMFAVGDVSAGPLADLVGGCKLHHACDLSKGIRTNDATGTVVFHLSRPDPEFLTNLASPDVVVVPPGTPNRDTGWTPLPATGPYRFGPVTPGKSIELDRNRKFHVWSPQATPDGYPEHIVWKVAPGSDNRAQTAAAVAEVRAGTADVFGAGIEGDSPTPDELQKIRAAEPAQVHDYLELATFYFVLNTKFPPFNDLDARRAVNFAVDREKALAAYPHPGRVTCQILPPNFLGYRPFCPYTLHPNGAGTWDAPASLKATHLVTKSGTRRTLIHMAEWRPFGGVAEQVRSELIGLGYRVALKMFPGGPNGFGNFYKYVLDPKNRVSMAGYWALSFSTSPAGWFTTGLTCEAPHGVNVGGFCDPQLDTKIKRATRVQIRDPAASAPLWARIDREATTKAPWLALFTTGGVDFVSKRVGNYQHNPVYGILTDQLWVK